MADGFDLQKSIKEYTSKITADIMSPKIKKRVQQEYSEHLEDSVFRYTVEGMSESDAFFKACEDMGEVGKMRFLLSCVHNNKVQTFLAENLVKPFKKTASSKSFFKFLFIALLVFVVIITYCVLNLATVMSNVLYWEALLKNPRFQKQTVWFISMLVAFPILFMILKSIVSAMGYFFGRIGTYFRIWVASVSSGCNFRLTRIPFASARGINSLGDVLIRANGKTYRIHFLDVVMKYSRSVTVLSEETYAVSKILPDEIGTYGATLVDGESMYNLYVTAIKSHTMWGERVRKFPKVDQTDTDEHILLIHQLPASVKMIDKNKLVILSDGEKIGCFEYCTARSFIRRLKREA